jgi:putative FmdB family regulatory protein
MPIYEYDCPKCGRFDVIQKASDKPVKKNPDCTKKDCPCSAQRVISASAFHLKGSGWYKTDYKASGSGSSSSSKSSSSQSSEGSTDASPSEKGAGDKKEKKSLKAAGGCGSGCGCH